LQLNEWIIGRGPVRVGAAGNRQSHLHGGCDPRHHLRSVDADLALQQFAAEIQAVLNAPDQAERLHPLQASGRHG
jgi:hypothetical protein